MQPASPPGSATRPLYIGPLRLTFPNSPEGEKRRAAAARAASSTKTPVTFLAHTPTNQASDVREPLSGVRTVAESPLGGQDAAAVLSNRSDLRAPTARPIDTLLYRFTDSSSPVPAPWECPRCTFEFGHTGVEAEFQACCEAPAQGAPT